MYYDNTTILFENGAFKKATAATQDLYGQTFHYGYGVFEGIRAYDTPAGTQIFKAAEHYERLHRSATLLGIPFPYKVQDLIETSYELLKMNGLTDAYLRPIVYCSPNMGLARPKEVSIAILCWKWGAYLGEQRLRLSISPYCRPHPRSTHVEAKACGHYINSILASVEAKDRGFDEALLLDSDGFLAEAPGSNLFFEKDKVLYTPQLGNILPGITRESILFLCNKMGIEVKEGLFSLDALLSADSAFLCGTAAEVIGLQSVDAYNFPLMWEESLGHQLQRAYKAWVTGNEVVANR